MVIVLVSWIYVSLSIGVSIIAHNQRRSAPVFFMISIMLTPIGSFLIYFFLSKPDEKASENKD